MNRTPNSVGQALKVCQQESAHPSRSWKGYCEMFCHFIYDVPAQNPTAIAQWHNTHPAHKFAGGNPDNAPLGSLLCFVRRDGSGDGHIMPAARPFPSGSSGAWSNDLVTLGDINKVHRNAPIIVWGHVYLGYITEINGYEIPVIEPKKRPMVHLSDILKAERADGAHSPQGHTTYPGQVKLVEHALLAEGLLNHKYAEDGSFGAATKDAYTQWQHKLGYRGKDADGKPGLVSLRKLGAKHGFRVTP